MIQIVFINSPAHSFTLSSPSDRLYLDELQETKRELLDLVETDEMLENARGRGRGRGRGSGRAPFTDSSPSAGGGRSGSPTASTCERDAACPISTG